MLAGHFPAYVLSPEVPALFQPTSVDVCAVRVSKYVRVPLKTSHGEADEPLICFVFRTFIAYLGKTHVGHLAVFWLHICSGVPLQEFDCAVYCTKLRTAHCTDAANSYPSVGNTGRTLSTSLAGSQRSPGLRSASP